MSVIEILEILNKSQIKIMLRNYFFQLNLLIYLLTKRDICEIQNKIIIL